MGFKEGGTKWSYVGFTICVTNFQDVGYLANETK